MCISKLELLRLRVVNVGSISRTAQRDYFTSKGISLGSRHR
jgi:hypothetical protein